MWKAITLRRPPRRPPVPPPAPPVQASAGHPFADLMAKLDQIPYTRRRPALGGR